MFAFLISINSNITGNVITDTKINTITDIGIIFSARVLLLIFFYRARTFLKKSK